MTRRAVLEKMARAMWAANDEAYRARRPWETCSEYWMQKAAAVEIDIEDEGDA